MYLSTAPLTRAKTWLSTLLLTPFVLIITSGCSVFGVESVEEAPYQLVFKEGQFEIRDYAPQVVVETRVNASFKEAGNEAFRKLFAYISGENEASEKIAMTSPVIAEVKNSESGETIAMTAPVTAQKDGESWRYRFVLPQTYSITSAPLPLNDDISLVETAPARAATLRYAGRASVKKQSENAEALINWIKSQGLESRSEPRWAGYNPPWTLPPFRRNEVLIDVSSQQLNEANDP